MRGQHPKPTKKAFEEAMNRAYGVTTCKWGNGRYGASKRPYGTYLRNQDPEKFNMDYEHWLAGELEIPPPNVSDDAIEAKRAARERSLANLALTNGRPSLSGDGTTSPTVQTRVPQWVKDALIAEAAELGYKTARSDGDGKLAQQVLIEHARRYLASQPIEKGSRVVLSRGLSVGPKAGALGTVRRLAGSDGLVRVHFDTDPDHRTYGVPAADLAREL
ncbi:hypothetical protein AWB85_06625 [Mycobacteroides immunogenum]|uniref:Uncharacterized protein n=2 Tax=Mycobacteroides immunogenum TaxID=83262 RepID=A0A179VIF4_9MYCO|nr:hypothetical protein AWB85_06625 [Mycobacteroides immunogenum]